MSISTSGHNYAPSTTLDRLRPAESVALKISILMCAFNEEQRIRQAIKEVLAVKYPCEIELIVIDDGSTDDTALLAESISDPRLNVHRHEVNRGKGHALRTAVSLATGTHMLPFDADLEYCPEDIPSLIVPLVRRNCQVVYGARLFGFNTVYQSYRYAAGNRFFTRLANMLFNASINDLHTCLKLVPLAVFRTLNLHERGFGLDTELTALLLRLGFRPFEVPVSYYSRSHAEGKKISWRDAVACVMILFKVRSRRKQRLLLAEAVAPSLRPVDLEITLTTSHELRLKDLASIPINGAANAPAAQTA